MSLDLIAIGLQARRMSNELAAIAGEREEQISRLHHLYFELADRFKSCPNSEELRLKPSPLPIAWPLEPLATIRDAPNAPATYDVVAVDSSQLHLDHHFDISCGLINIGAVYIRYGNRPRALLSSYPLLLRPQQDLVYPPQQELFFIDDADLGEQRVLAERAMIATLSEALLEQDIPHLSLLSGSLYKRGAKRREPIHPLPSPLTSLDYIEAMESMNHPIAGYIQSPSSTDALRFLQYVSTEIVDQPETRKRTPYSFSIAHHLQSNILDSDVLKSIIKDGQRSAVFGTFSFSKQAILRRHRTDFFYLAARHNIVRVEIPHWIAENTSRIEELHAIVYDQCIRGCGKPAALSRASEQAMLRAADRRTVLDLIERGLVRAGAKTNPSQKWYSKYKQGL